METKTFTPAQKRALKAALNNQLMHHFPMRTYTQDKYRGMDNDWFNYKTISAIYHLIKVVEQDQTHKIFTIKKTQDAIDEMVARGFLVPVQKEDGKIVYKMVE